MNLRDYGMFKYSVVMLLTESANGRKSAGTGFIVEVSNGLEKRYVVITNAHIVNDAAIITAYFACSSGLSVSTVDSIAITQAVDSDLPITFHPRRDIDLAAFPIAPFSKTVFQKYGVCPICVPIPNTAIVTQSAFDRYEEIEKVVTCGFPGATFSDQIPVSMFRHGITATDIRDDFRGLPVFVCDLEAVNGMSGSPVFRIDESTMNPELIGVQYAILAQTVRNDRCEKAVPYTTLLGLGLCIKAYEINTLIASIPDFDTVYPPLRQ